MRNRRTAVGYAVLLHGYLAVASVLLTTPVLAGQGTRPLQVTYVYSQQCLSCQHARPVVEKAIAEAPVRVEVARYDINSREGAEYARTQGIDDPDNAYLPSMEELQAAAKHTSIEDVVIDEAASTVYLKDPAMSLDVGAVGKGYAVEQVCRLAEQQGFTSGLVSIGGNVRAIGSKGKNQPWDVGIQNPDKESANTYLNVVNLSGMSLVSSGGYERYYTVNGKDYNHIIDPQTLYPAEYFRDVTILCQDSGLADALSTAIFTMPFDEGLALIESLPGVEALWVLPSGELKYSSHFKDYVKK
jgi:thiamine biosynthesis lipoprotein